MGLKHPVLEEKSRDRKSHQNVLYIVITLMVIQWLLGQLILNNQMLSSSRH